MPREKNDSAGRGEKLTAAGGRAGFLFNHSIDHRANRAALYAAVYTVTLSARALSGAVKRTEN